jgi:hypothetical protein
VPLAKIQELLRYWGTDYDWRKVEATLNALPQFVTTINGLDIQFVHVRSRHPNALPLIMTHGWPGSIIELLKVSSRGPLAQATTKRLARSWLRQPHRSPGFVVAGSVGPGAGERPPFGRRTTADERKVEGKCRSEH